MEGRLFSTRSSLQRVPDEPKDDGTHVGEAVGDPPKQDPTSATDVMKANSIVWRLMASKPFSRRRLAIFQRKLNDASHCGVPDVVESGDDQQPLVAVPSKDALRRDIKNLEELDFDLFPDKRIDGPYHRIFCVNVFLLEFLTHLLYPLSIPVVMYLQGKGAAVNKGFIPGKPVFQTQFYYFIIFALPIVLLVASPNGSGDNWALGPVVIGSSFTIFRMLIIGGKYASFKHAKYLKVVMSDYNCLKDLLLTSITVDDVVLDDLLEEAEVESGIHLSEMKFVLADGVTQISARVYATALIRCVFHRIAPGNPALHQFGRIFPGLLAAMYPVATFVAQCNDHNNGYSIALLIVNIVQTVAYSAIMFGFLGYAILYYERMNALRQTHVGSLLFTGSSATVVKPIDANDAERDVDIEADDHADIAMIPACSTPNLIVWATLGNVFCHFATTTTRRMCFNFVATLFVAALLAGTLVLQAMRAGGTADIYLVVIVSYLFSAKAFAMVIATLFAFSANRAEVNVVKKLEEENFTFLWREMVNDMMRDGNPSGQPRSRSSSTGEPLACASNETYLPFMDIANHKVEAEHYSKAMEIVRELITRRNEVEPLRVMYVGASVELVSFFGSIAVSGAFLIVGIVYHTVPGQ